MAIKPKDIYKGRKKTRKAGRTIAIVIVLLIVAAISLFFGLRHYAVYDESGNAKIVLPFFAPSESGEPEG